MTTKYFFPFKTFFPLQKKILDLKEQSMTTAFYYSLLANYFLLINYSVINQIENNDMI